MQLGKKIVYSTFSTIPKGHFDTAWQRHDNTSNAIKKKKKKKRGVFIEKTSEKRHRWWTYTKSTCPWLWTLISVTCLGKKCKEKIIFSKYLYMFISVLGFGTQTFFLWCICPFEWVTSPKLRGGKIHRLSPDVWIAQNHRHTYSRSRGSESRVLLWT